MAPASSTPAETTSATATSTSVAAGYRHGHKLGGCGPCHDVGGRDRDWKSLAVEVSRRPPLSLLSPSRDGQSSPPMRPRLKRGFLGHRPPPPQRPPRFLFGRAIVRFCRPPPPFCPPPGWATSPATSAQTGDRPFEKRSREALVGKPADGPFAPPPTFRHRSGCSTRCSNHRPVARSWTIAGSLAVRQGALPARRSAHRPHDKAAAEIAIPLPRSSSPPPGRPLEDVTRLLVSEPEGSAQFPFFRLSPPGWEERGEEDTVTACPRRGEAAASPGAALSAASRSTILPPRPIAIFFLSPPLSACPSPSPQKVRRRGARETPLRRCAWRKPPRCQGPSSWSAEPEMASRPAPMTTTQ